MKQGISIHDYNRNTHEFWREGSLLLWYRGARGPDTAPDATFHAETFRSDVLRLGAYQGSPTGRYRLQRSNGYLGIPHLSLIHWFGGSGLDELNRLLDLSMPDGVRRVVSV